MGDLPELLKQLPPEVLQELKSSAGLAYGRVSLEVLYLLPLEFRDTYIHLFWEALKEDGTGTSVSPLGKAKGDTSGTKGPQASGGGKKYKNAWVIRNEKALAKKQRIDQKLRAIASEIQRFLDHKDTTPPRKCRGEHQGRKCGRFLDPTHNFCPNCGASARG